MTEVVVHPPPWSTPATPCTLLDLGLRPYREVWDLQKKLQRELINGTGTDTVIVCEHPLVLTSGKLSNPESFKITRELISDRGVEIIEIERGGDVTAHAPGQLVLYPIINLHHKRTDVGWYMRSLEEVVLRTLHECGISANRSAGRTGVWISDTKKIASLGVRISRWCTMHGLALNVTQDSERAFECIHPCGLHGVTATSIEGEGGTDCTTEQVRELLLSHFAQIFNYNFIIREALRSE